MSTDQWKFGWDRPVTVHRMKIGVADTGELDVDKHFVWAWLSDWDLLVLDRATASASQLMGTVNES